MHKTYEPENEIAVASGRPAAILVSSLMVCVLWLVIPIVARASEIDPEVRIQKSGYQTRKIGDDGKTVFFSSTERVQSSRIAELENEVAKLPKGPELLKMCDFIRGGVKAKLIQQRGISFDVAVVNYGYSGSTIACVLKYMHEGMVGTQLSYMKQSAAGVYMVFVTD